MTISQRLASVIAALSLTVAATACAAPRGPADWDRGGLVDGQVGRVRLVHVHVLAPPKDQQKVGGNLPLHLTLVNTSDREQVLDGVSTVEADQVVFLQGPAAAPPPEQLRVMIPPNGQLSLQAGQDRPHLELVGTHRQLGRTPIPITFRFPTAGSITLWAPVKFVGDPPDPTPSATQS